MEGSLENSPQEIRKIDLDIPKINLINSDVTSIGEGVLERTLSPRSRKISVMVHQPNHSQHQPQNEKKPEER